MYQFLPLDRNILIDPAYVPGSIPMYHMGFINEEEPWIVSAEIQVRGPNGFVTNIPKGFTYDMASVPLLLRRVLPKAHPQIVRAATLHDWLYDRRIGTKEEADNHFLNVLEQDGLDSVRRNSAYWAVKFFGQGAWDD